MMGHLEHRRACPFHDLGQLPIGVALEVFKKPSRVFDCLMGCLQDGVDNVSFDDGDMIEFRLCASCHNDKIYTLVVRNRTGEYQ